MCIDANPVDQLEDENLAWSDWLELMQCFWLLHQCFSEAFPLKPVRSGTLSTPFGPALMSETTIASTLWAWYYSMLVLAYRGVPWAPPETSASIAAVAEYAEDFARIVGCILYTLRDFAKYWPRDEQGLGSFAECCIPFFFVALQFGCPEQQRWTTDCFAEVFSLTGWGNIEVLAGWCRASWATQYPHLAEIS